MAWTNEPSAEHLSLFYLLLQLIHMEECCQMMIRINHRQQGESTSISVCQKKDKSTSIVKEDTTLKHNLKLFSVEHNFTGNTLQMLADPVPTSDCKVNLTTRAGIARRAATTRIKLIGSSESGISKSKSNLSNSKCNSESNSKKWCNTI
eukprot:jgi/Psemu1/14644/gm1.14644_g